MNQQAYTMGPEETAQYLAARARKARLFGVKIAPKPQPTNVISVMKWADRPMWRKVEMRFDEHVLIWKRFHRVKAARPVMFYIQKRCDELMTTREEIFGTSRFREVALKRHQLVWEVHNRFGLSLSQIGMIFGGRDHTTVLNSIKRVDAMRENANGL